jgi:hypothetical protein
MAPTEADAGNNERSAPMNPLISEFVHDAVLHGVSREDITRALQKGGWDPKEIQDAVNAYVESDLPVPVPRKRVSSSPKEAFIFLMLFASLYTAAFALGSVLFDLINLVMPLPGEIAWRSIVSLRYGLACIVVAFPSFLFMCRVVLRETARNPGQRIAPVRRWLTYMTLFIASISIVADLITLIVRFLEGDITVRFGLKVLVVAVLAGAAFIYYLRDLRKDEVEPSSPVLRAHAAKIGIVVLIAAVLAAVVAGFWFAGSPAQARMLAQDEQRIRDLAAISRSVEKYYSSWGSLPESLAACDRNPDTYIAQKTDRVTGKPYEYRILDANRFELGASFALPSGSGAPGRKYLSPADEGFWKHQAGAQKFIIDVTQEKQ